MRPQVFLLGLAYGASRLNANKSETFPPIYYTTIQSTWKISQQLVCLHQNQKINVQFETI